MNGIEKEFDDLGRIVIPVKYRRKLGLEAKSKVLIVLEDDTLLISPVNKYCALCSRKISESKRFRLCDGCILKIKNEI